MSLVVTTEPIENRQLAVTIQPSKERVEKELQKAARKISSKMGVPGFRKGKAPYSMIVRAYGIGSLYNEFVDALGQELYKQAIEQEKIQPYATASLDNIEMEPTLTYKLTIPLEPKIELGDYRSLRVEQDQPQVSEETIDERLERYRDQYSDWKEVVRPAQYGDMLKMNVKSVIVNEDGSEGNSVLDETDWEVTLDETNPLEPAGLDAELLGMTPGESKTFNLTWPEESQSINAGKTARFEVALSQIQSYEKPELNNALAQMVGPDFETLDALKENIRQSLVEQEKQRLEGDFIDKALDAVVEASTLDYPPVVIEDQIDGMMQDIEMRLRQMGVDDVNWYFQQIGQTPEVYRESVREPATEIARRNLVLSEVLTAEKLAVSDTEIEERINLMTISGSNEQNEQSLRLADSLRNGPARSILVSQLLREKGIQRILAIVRGEEVPEPGSDAPQIEASGEVAADAEVTSTVIDDYTRIEGIGPKINGILHEAGLSTYAHLADAKVDDLKAILTASNLTVNNPATWPQQAALAAAGKFEELEALQAQLDGGRAV